MNVSEPRSIARSNFALTTESTSTPLAWLSGVVFDDHWRTILVCREDHVDVVVGVQIGVVREVVAVCVDATRSDGAERQVDDRIAEVARARGVVAIRCVVADDVGRIRPIPRPDWRSSPTASRRLVSEWLR